MTLKEVQDEIIEEFEVFDEWLDKYEYLIELGNSLAPIDVKYKSNDYLINRKLHDFFINTLVYGE